MDRILFAEDEIVLGQIVKEALEREKDFEVDWITNGKTALERFMASPPDICILDVMMPIMDGYTLAKHMRLVNKNLPIIFLTARSQTADLVKGFEAGGNDYIKKPFVVEELVVRIRALLSRNKGTELNKVQELYSFGSYQFNPVTQVLKCKEAKYNLSNKEAELLRELIININSLMDRKKVLISLWGDDNFFNARNMDVYIGKLRKYLAYDPNLSIVNIRGYGYKLIEQV